MLRFIISLCVVSVCVLAAPPQDVVPLEKHQPTVIPIISQSEEFEPNGTYKFSYETGNGIKREEIAYDKVVPRAKSADSNEGGESEDSDEIHVQEGSWSYTAPDGTLISVRYIADENGFRPVGDHIPKGPDPVSAVASIAKSGRALKTQDNTESKSSVAPTPELLGRSAQLLSTSEVSLNKNVSDASETASTAKTETDQKLGGEKSQKKDAGTSETAPITVSEPEMNATQKKLNIKEKTARPKEDAEKFAPTTESERLPEKLSAEPEGHKDNNSEKALEINSLKNTADEKSSKDIPIENLERNNDKKTLITKTDEKSDKNVPEDDLSKSTSEKESPKKEPEGASSKSPEDVLSTKIPEKESSKILDMGVTSKLPQEAPPKATNELSEEAPSTKALSASELLTKGPEESQPQKSLVEAPLSNSTEEATPMSEHEAESSSKNADPLSEGESKDVSKELSMTGAANDTTTSKAPATA